MKAAIGLFSSVLSFFFFSIFQMSRERANVITRHTPREELIFFSVDWFTHKLSKKFSVIRKKNTFPCVTERKRCCREVEIIPVTRLFLCFDRTGAIFDWLYF